jgi:hypothetical protein
LLVYIMKKVMIWPDHILANFNNAIRIAITQSKNVPLRFVTEKRVSCIIQATFPAMKG